jgi:putative membrane protein
MTMMFWYHPGLSTWAWIGMTVGMVLFWGLVITGVMLVVRYLAGTEDTPTPSLGSPERLLAERFARGEIDEHEYTSRLATLHGQGRP